MNRLREHDTVLVAPPTSPGRGFEAVVLLFSERGMTLTAVDPREVSRLPDVSPGTIISFRHQRSLVALTGTLFRVEPRGDMRFQVSEPAMRRPRGTRINYVMQVEVRPKGTDMTTECSTVDIGADGMLIECDLPLAVGDRLAIAFSSVDAQELITGTAEVVRGMAGGLVVLRLPPSSVNPRNALGDIVAEHSRAALSERANKPQPSRDH